MRSVITLQDCVGSGLLTGIGIGNIVGTITKGGEDKGNGSDCENPVIIGSHERRHLECVVVKLWLMSSMVLGT